MGGRFAILVLAAIVIAAATAGPVRSESTGREEAVPVASEARVAGDKARTRFVVDLGATVDLTVFALADPYRVIIDLPEIDFQLADGSGEQGRGLISAFRYGAFAPGRSRIVLDVTDPVAVDKAFVLPAIEGQPARMVVDLVKSDRNRFLSVQAETLARLRDNGAAAKPKGDKPVIDSANEEAGLPVVVIDPGHGGIDGGTSGSSGVAEKAVVLEFAKLLRQKLEDTGRFKVVMTREDDTFVALGDRVRIARESSASLFVSIHADSLNDQSFRGASVYTLSDEATDSEAAALAEKENRADIVAGLALPETENEVADILYELTQRETRTFSVSFAKRLISEMKSAVKLVNNPHRAAGLKVLRAPDVPSILIELGYLSNTHDEKLMTSEEWRERTADAALEAVNGFFSRRLAQGNF